MKERGKGGNAHQEPHTPHEERRTPEEDGRILLPDTLKERMPPLYSQENERDPLVVCKFFDPVGSWTWYATEGSPVDEDGYYDTGVPVASVHKTTHRCEWSSCRGKRRALSTAIVD